MAFKQLDVQPCGLGDLDKAGRGASPLLAGAKFSIKKGEFEQCLKKQPWENDDPNASVKEGWFPVVESTYTAPEHVKGQKVLVPLSKFRDDSRSGFGGETVTVGGTFRTTDSFPIIGKKLAEKNKDADLTFSVVEKSINYGIGQRQGRVTSLLVD